jgi:hypothetical protein
MKRSRSDYSNFVDVIEGPCVVCGKEVRFVIPADRPDPVLLYHPTCEMMPKIREHLQTVPPPPLMPAKNVIVKAKPAPTPATPPPATPK